MKQLRFGAPISPQHVINPRNCQTSPTSLAPRTSTPQIRRRDELIFAEHDRDIVMISKNLDYQMSIGCAIGSVYGDVYAMNMLYSCYGKDRILALLTRRFTKTDDPDNAPVKPVLHFYPWDTCASYIGRIFTLEKQDVRIGAGCERFETATHEIAHALGFIHEHNRWDRDEIFAENDRDIVMISKNLDYQMSIGCAIGPAYGDVYAMNYDRCKNSGTVCHNEGMPHPKNCRVCPNNFGGSDCSQRQVPSHGLT
uniref:ZnMc domain-containing protein n=1 Tax=Steinernema glaseri TaxID=37863 RepID=A0A1I7Y0J4_9BILA